MRTSRLALILCAAVLALSACSGAATPTTTTSPPTTTTPPTSPSTTQVGPVEIDWGEQFLVDLTDGWTLDSCEEGAANFICLNREGEWAGSLEHLAFPRDSFELLEGVEDPREAAEALAGDFISTFAEDRGNGCPDYEYRPADSQPSTVGGEPGVRTGFSLWRDGVEEERVVLWIGVSGETVNMVNWALAGSSPCLPPEGPALSPSVAPTLLPWLDAAVAGSRFAPQP